MFDLPSVVEAQFVGEFNLREGDLVEFQLVPWLPWAEQLQFIKNAQFHRSAPGGSLPGFQYVRGQCNEQAGTVHPTGGGGEAVGPMCRG